MVYQAYSSVIADASLAAQTFVSPFSVGRMSWIKPSYLWLMHRSNWARKPNQERVLGVRITRVGWERALSLAVLTRFEPTLWNSPEQWDRDFAAAKVHLQWDPERSSRGAALEYDSIQIGLSRHVIREFVEDWIVGIEDLTARTRKIHGLLESGDAARAKRLLPPERVYPIDAELGVRALIGSRRARA